MKNFEFTNEQIIYLHSHFEDYLATLEGDIQKQNEFVAGQLDLLEKTYGDKPEFNHEAHNLHRQLMVEEMPKMIAEKAAFIRNLKNKFSEIYELLEDADPDYVAGVKEQLFEQPQHIKDIVKQLETMEHGKLD